MKNPFSLILVVSAMAITLLPSCSKKNSTETTTVSKPPYQIGQTISPGNLAKGAYKGTMTTGNTYTLTGDFTINIGDTVLLQPGVTVCVQTGVTIIVKGVLISLGTQAQQNYFTACGVKKVDDLTTPPISDPAFSGKWTGINCDTSCRLLDLQWTHIEFVGGTFSTTEPFVGGSSGTVSFGIMFQNPNGDLILMDSWMYGSVDDAIRMAGGRVCLMRNTIEKMGELGGDGFNAKHGTQGVMAYNLCIGDATNSTKASDKGSGSNIQCNINMYNNTYVDCGYRQASFSSRGSDIDYEQGAKGLCYNNLMINCRNGIRIGDGQNGIPMPDTTNTITLNNYIYADSVEEVDQFYPVIAGTWTRPNAYVVPTDNYLPPGFYNPGSNVNGGDDLPYDAPSLAGANNPMFKNFPLPEHLSNGENLSDLISLETGVAITGSNYDFHLTAGSPAINKGYTNFTGNDNIINPVSVDMQNHPNLFPAGSVTAPGVDMGCYQSNGVGNQH